MKKLLKLLLTVLLIASLALVITGCGNNKDTENTTQESKIEDNGKSKTYNVLNKVFSGENYVISLEGNTDMGNGEETVEMTLATKGEDICMDVKATSQHATVIYKDNTTYIISHDEKMYITMEGKDEDTFEEDMTLISKEDLKKIETQEYKTGKETINGTEYEYEEYKDEENQATERYYFSKGDLKYVKSIDENGIEVLMKVIKLSSEVDDNIFQIPSDYEKLEM